MNSKYGKMLFRKQYTRLNITMKCTYFCLCLVETVVKRNATTLYLALRPYLTRLRCLQDNIFDVKDSQIFRSLNAFDRKHFFHRP